MAIPAPIAFFQAAAAAAASAVPVTAGSSPQVSLIPSDDTEDFPALPSAVVESFATRTPSSQPPTIPKPHPAPPVTRKVTALPKPTKAETKKPALTPLTTNIDTKSAQNDEAGQPSAIEVVSAISVKAENKGKKVVHELISVVSVASTPVTASPSTQSRTVTKPAKKAERVEKIEHPKSPTHSTSSKGVSATKAPANKGAASTPSAPTQPPAPASALIEVIEHAPIVARQTKKSKPQQLPKKKPAAKPEEPATKETTTTSEPQTTPTAPVEPSVAVAAPNPSNPTSLEGLLGQLQDQLGVHSMRFFSDRCLKSQEIVEYKPLIEALSTLARDPHSQIASSNNSSNVSIASTTIDNAMASFQQLLITLTQTVSDLLHLVPPSTWSDNGAFEEVIQEMLNYNFQDSENPSKELRNAVSKLEELHHDINSASTRAVLTVNDRGWDCASFLPRAGNTAAAYEMLGKYVTGGEVKTMDVVQLEKQLALAEKEVQTTSDELQRAMAINASLLA
jgi:CCR4-NOT transcription complex subunit 4